MCGLTEMSFPTGREASGRDGNACCGGQRAPHAPFRDFGKAGFISVGGARFTCKEKCGSGVLPNEIQQGESGGRNSSGSGSLQSGARLLIALRLQSLHAGAGVALVAAHALQAPSFVRVARAAAAAPVEVCGQRVRALHVHVYLFCEQKGRRYRTATRHPPVLLARWRGPSHLCPSPSAPRTRWIRCCPSVASPRPSSPAASSGAAAPAAAGRFGGGLSCRSLQASAEVKRPDGITSSTHRSPQPLYFPSQ